MGIATRAAVVAIGMMIAASPSVGLADDRDTIEEATRAAMEAYDMLEYEEAKKGLSSALIRAKGSGLGKDPVAAQVHLHLGIVYFSGFEDSEAAKLQFANAIEVDSSIELPVAYRTNEMVDVFDSLKAKLAAPSAAGSAGSASECDVIEGLDHELIETSPAGDNVPVTVAVGSELKVGRVMLHYRADGAERFEELTMGRQGQCGYYGAVPAEATEGSVVHYFVTIRDARGRSLASAGSKGSPNIIEITEAVHDDDDNPFAPRAKKSEGARVEKRSAEKAVSFFLAVAAGSGGGYVTGDTEAAEVGVQCCFAPALFHIAPEVGYWLSPRTALSVVARIGFPIGANVDGHATIAPAGLVRLRHGFADDGTGFQLSAAIGGGILRHTVKIEDAGPGMDTDTTATGPLLFSVGAGYIKSLTKTLRLLAEVHGLAGVPVVDQLGCPGNGCVRPNFGTQIDINLGLVVAF